MQPELDDKRPAQDQETQDQDGEHGRPVAGVDECELEAALRAALTHLERERPAEQLTLAAPRAAAAEPGGNWRDCSRRLRGVAHHGTISARQQPDAIEPFATRGMWPMASPGSRCARPRRPGSARARPAPPAD